MSDPRGPFRTVKAAEATATEIRVTFVECEHTAHLVAFHPAPKPGERERCFACRDAEK